MPSPTAPQNGQLYLSLSGTQRDDWTKQLLFYGAVIFVGGFVLGRVTAKPKLPRLPRSRTL